MLSALLAAADHDETWSVWLCPDSAEAVLHAASVFSAGFHSMLHIFCSSITAKHPPDQMEALWKHWMMKTCCVLDSKRGKSVINKWLMTAHDCISKVIMIYRDCVNAEIVHFYTKKNVKNCSIKILMRPRTQDVDLKNSLHLLWMLNRFCCLSNRKNFRTKLSDFTSWWPYWI